MYCGFSSSINSISGRTITHSLLLNRTAVKTMSKITDVHTMLQNPHMLTIKDASMKCLQGFIENGSFTCTHTHTHTHTRTSILSSSMPESISQFLLENNFKARNRNLHIRHHYVNVYYKLRPVSHGLFGQAYICIYIRMYVHVHTL